MTQISLRQSPPGSHSSNGMAEVTVKTIEGLTRTFVHAIKKHYQVTVKGNSAILGWIVRHAAFIYNRFMVKPSGRTPIEELKLVRYDSPVLTFGEVVLGRMSGVPDNRLSSAWSVGIWLGRATETNELIVGTVWELSGAEP